MNLAIKCEECVHCYDIIHSETNPLYNPSGLTCSCDFYKNSGWWSSMTRTCRAFSSKRIDNNELREEEENDL